MYVAAPAISRFFVGFYHCSRRFSFVRWSWRRSHTYASQTPYNMLLQPIALTFNGAALAVQKYKRPPAANSCTKIAVKDAAPKGNVITVYIIYIYSLCRSLNGARLAFELSPPRWNTDLIIIFASPVIKTTRCCTALCCWSVGASV